MDAIELLDARNAVGATLRTLSLFFGKDAFEKNDLANIGILIVFFIKKIVLIDK